jgi:DmsE family decaheme c-type cytochrome
MRPYVMGGLTLLLILGLSPSAAYARAQQQESTQSQPVQQQEPEEKVATPETAPAEAQQGEQATMRCSDCHEQVKPFLGNPHARGHVANSDVPNTVCESCHGDGDPHMEAGGDPTLIMVPKGREGADKVCVSCHNTTSERRSHRGGAHANSAAVNCLSCHSIHHAHKNSAELLVKPEIALCSSCHGTQAASFRNRPYAHRIGRGGMGCSSCHEPHSRPGKENLRLTAAGETPCLGCHSEVRGPHVFEHGALTTGEAECQSCHEPHGSSNPKQLRRATVTQLCLECHSPLTHETLGSQPPSFHNISNVRYQNCTTCHVAVHGSNRSPALLK